MRPRRRVLRIIALVAVLLLVWPAVSYARALTAPGSATFTMRTVDWVRSNNGNGVVNAIENWWYTRHKPAAGPPDAGTLPSIGTGTARVVGPPQLPLLKDVTPLPGEATWSAGRTGANGQPLIYTGFLRPDRQHLSIVAGVAWIRAAGTVTHLVAGTAQPGGAPWPGNAAVPSGDVGKLVATFNSGFKMKDTPGGFFLGGRYSQPLTDGLASLVIRRDGSMTIGSWGTDVAMGPDVVAVRQNLHLVVDHGRPVDGIATNANGRWGSPRNQYQYTWRSGAGLDRDGNLIYVAGDKMNLTTLAAAMVDAGIVRGMQLDIHTGMSSFASWQPSGTATKLLPAMSRSANRYLQPDQRDFFYVTAG
ncbi:phosphodiester glycosidase family protein [Actinoplanes sp. HUAS TT8]|uniref:phosphodiester glycosidase family protein n=1 Tax=Actinoplanes sp. HUAS TT8 TaxID=3447453 RepID=UPI003F520A57